MNTKLQKVSYECIQVIVFRHKRQMVTTYFRYIYIYIYIYTYMHTYIHTYIYGTSCRRHIQRQLSTTAMAVAVRNRYANGISYLHRRDILLVHSTMPVSLPLAAVSTKRPRQRLPQQIINIAPLKSTCFTWTPLLWSYSPQTVAQFPARRQRAASGLFTFFHKWIFQGCLRGVRFRWWYDSPWRHLDDASGMRAAANSKSHVYWWHYKVPRVDYSPLTCPLWPFPRVSWAFWDCPSGCAATMVKHRNSIV